MPVHKLVHNPVHSRPPYLVLRGGVFCFRFRLPRHVRQLCPGLPREIKRTLRTDSFAEALYLINQKTELIRRIKQSRCKATLERLCSQLADFSGEYEGLVARFALAPQAVAGAAQGTEQSLLGAQAQPQPLISPESVSPKLSQAWKDFVAWKRWPEKLRRNNEMLFENLLFFLGDVSVHQISKKDLRNALEAIRGLPQRNRKPYQGKPLKDLVKLSIPEEHRISGKTVKEHLKLCQSLFSSYLVKEREILSSSPTEGLTLDYDDQRFAALGDAQVREILEKAKKKPEWVRWFMLLAAYSGARRSELANLATRDFKRCPDTGRYYFVINGGKTKAARRMVPVHPELERAGLIAWVQETDGPLFPTAQANPNRVTDHFASLAGVKVNDVGERIVFHSLRHTFITKARAAGVSTVLIQQVVGHEKSGAGITDRYTHSFPLKDVLVVVDAVRYGEPATADGGPI